MGRGPKLQKTTFLTHHGRSCLGALPVVAKKRDKKGELHIAERARTTGCQWRAPRLVVKPTFSWSRVFDLIPSSSSTKYSTLSLALFVFFSL